VGEGSPEIPRFYIAGDDEGLGALLVDATTADAIVDPDTGMCALHVAAAEGQSACCAALLDKGAEV
jgi:hypothetical protein